MPPGAGSRRRTHCRRGGSLARAPAVASGSCASASKVDACARRSRKTSRSAWRKPVDRLELSPTVKTSVKSECATRSMSSHCSRFVSWNSSTMTIRKRSCVASRTDASSRAGRAASCRSSKSTTDSRRFVAAYSARTARAAPGGDRDPLRPAPRGRLLQALACGLERGRAPASRRERREVDELSGREPSVTTRSASQAFRRCVSVADASAASASPRRAASRSHSCRPAHRARARGRVRRSGASRTRP